jgi:hypothetical protein
MTRGRSTVGAGTVSSQRRPARGVRRRITSSGANRGSAQRAAISARRLAYCVQAHQAGWSGLSQAASVSTLPPKTRVRSSVRVAERRSTRRMTTAREKSSQTIASARDHSRSRTSG